MKTTPTNPVQPKGTVGGTMVGTVISLGLIFAFGLSSYISQQDSENRHASEYSNRPSIISAYLA
jgi:O-antigen/teichoic acid export membrane protein